MVITAGAEGSELIITNTDRYIVSYQVDMAAGLTFMNKQSFCGRPNDTYDTNLSPFFSKMELMSLLTAVSVLISLSHTVQNTSCTCQQDIVRNVRSGRRALSYFTF